MGTTVSLSVGWRSHGLAGDLDDTVTDRQLRRARRAVDTARAQVEVVDTEQNARCDITADRALPIGWG